MASGRATRPAACNGSRTPWTPPRSRRSLANGSGDCRIRFARAHRAAGYRYQLSILQSEFALTQVLDRPLTGRCFFEEVIRGNLDLGRPDQMQLIFDRRVSRRTPCRFRTRVLTEGVVPSLPWSTRSAR
jgi:hypothetical protein